MLPRKPWPRWLSLTAALFLLNVSLACSNIWPTPAVTWRGDLSIELVVAVLALIVANRVFGPPTTTLLRVLGIVWTILVVGHYADVTAPALYGRAVNLYWDLRFVPAVAEMLASAASRWLVILVIAGAAVVLTLLYKTLRWAFGRVGEALADNREQRTIGRVARWKRAYRVAMSGCGWRAAVARSTGLRASSRRSARCGFWSAAMPSSPAPAAS